MLVFALYWLLLLVCSGLTMWFAGREGRMAAAIVFIFPLVDLGVWLVDKEAVDLWVFPATLDLLQLICFAVLMRKSRRWWPIWLTGFQIDAVLAHISGALAPAHTATIFRGLHTFWGTPILIVMMLGALFDHRAHLSDEGKRSATLGANT